MLFHEPSGTIPSVAEVPTSAVAAGRTVPSPPATTTSRPSAAAAAASCARIVVLGQHVQIGLQTAASQRRRSMAAGSGRSTAEPGRDRLAAGRSD